jgi:hypothetical protein
LYTFAVILIVLWVIGFATSFTLGGVIHILLVIAVIMIIFQFLTIIISGQCELGINYLIFKL